MHAVPRRVIGEARSLFERAPRQHGGEMLPVIGRGVDVGHRVDRAAAFAGLGEQLGARRLAGDRRLDVACTHRRDRNAALFGTLEFNPLMTVDLGYLTVRAAVSLAKGDLKPGATSYQAGRLGAMEIQGDNILLGKPFIFNKANIDHFNF